jgi:ribosome recycling factor
VEQGRVAVRNVRRDAHDHLRQLEREHKISEDEFRRAEQELQKLTDSFIKEVDQLGEAKEEEVLKV